MEGAPNLHPVDEFETARREAVGLYGERPLRELAWPDAAAISCSSTAVEEHLRIAQASLRTLQALLVQQGARMPGLWMGTMRVCRPVVADARVIETEMYPGDLAVTIRFVPAAGRELALLTTGRVGELLSVRLDGRSISEPVVNEAILGGEIQLSVGGIEGQAHLIRDAALRP